MKEKPPISAASKAPRGKVASLTNLKIGDLVFIKDKRSKNNARDRYIITSIDGKYAQLQKLSSKFTSGKHTVNLSKMYSAGNMNITGHVFDNENIDNSDYEIDHDCSIQYETCEGKDGNIDKEEEEEKHQTVQHETNERRSTRSTTTVNEEW